MTDEDEQDEIRVEPQDEPDISPGSTIPLMVTVEEYKYAPNQYEITWGDVTAGGGTMSDALESLAKELRE